MTPHSKVKLAAKMIKTIHAQESKKAAREKAKAVAAELKTMKLKGGCQAAPAAGRLHSDCVCKLYWQAVDSYFSF